MNVKISESRLRNSGISFAHLPSAQTDSSVSPLQNYTDFHLTTRERQVLILIASGYSNKYAARELGISPYTIAGYIKEIYRKLQISSRSEATIAAIKLGLLDKNLLVSVDAQQTSL